MNSNDDQEKELRRKQKELEEREKLLRLKELENEIYERAEREKEDRIRDQQKEPDFYPTRKDNPPENKLVRWQKKAMNIVKFGGFMVAAFITIKVAYTLSLVIMITGIGWFAYKIFIEKDMRD